VLLLTSIMNLFVIRKSVIDRFGLRAPASAFDIEIVPLNIEFEVHTPWMLLRSMYGSFRIVKQ
jgi:hypothetical protein